MNDLRAGLRRLGAQHPPPPAPDLAATAVRRADRIHRNRVTASAAAVVVVIVATVLAVTTLTGASANRSANRPVQRVISSAGCTGIPYEPQHEVTSLVLDRSTGRYAQVPHCVVRTSPDGTQALIVGWRRDVPHSMAPSVGVLTVASGEVRWVDGDASGFPGWSNFGSRDPGQWSPDGSRLLLTGRRLDFQDHTGDFQTVLVLDADTLTGARLAVPLPRCGVGFGATWLPDGSGFAVTRFACPADGDANIIGIAEYDLSGRLTRGIRSTHALWPGAYSPDGRLAALVDRLDSWGSPDVRLVDSRTYKHRGSFRLPAETRLAGWYDDKTLVAQQRPRTGRPARLLLLDLQGRVLRAVERQVGAYPVQLGPAAGVPDPDGIAF